MIKASRTFLLISALWVSAHSPAAESPEPPLLITGGWLFDGHSDTRRPNMGILVEDGVITAVDLADGPRALPEARLLVLDDADTVLPGFFDLHAHYNLDLVDQGRVEEVVNNSLVFLANGVTATWSAGEYVPERMLAHRDRIEAGDALGPRIFASGPYFGGFRCEYAVKVAEDDCIAWPNDITEAEIRAEVDHWAARGVISLKIKQATPGEMRIIIDQARKHGMTTAGHLGNYNVEYDVTTRDAILMGLDRIEHQLTLALSRDDPRSAETEEMVRLVLEHEVFYDPNLQMYGGINLRRANPGDMVWTDEAKYFTPYTRGLLEARGPPPPESAVEEYEQRVAELLALYEAGGKDLLIVGTDEPVYTSLLPGFAYHRELWAMNHAGLPNAVVLKAATINGARALGVADRLGSVEAGKLADLVILRGDPLADIKATRDIRHVIKAGVVYEPALLLESAEGGIGPSGPQDHADWVLEVAPLRR